MLQNPGKAYQGRGKLTVVPASSSVSTIVGVVFALAGLLQIVLSGRGGQRSPLQVRGGLWRELV